MKRSTLKLHLVAIVFLLFSGNLYSQSTVYLRSSGEPWGSNSNIESLNTVFGEDNWQDLRFETVNINSLFNGVDYIFLEGSDSHADALESFLIDNLPALETWVQSGGLLFINSGPNQGDGMEFGFGGVSLDYFNGTSNVVAVDVEHPIFNGPFLPVGNNWSGSFGHATIAGPGLTPLIVDQGNESRIVLAEKRWGRGLVLFGGMTMTNYHSPNPEAFNLRSNILSLKLLNGANDAGVANLTSPKDFCPGTHPIDVTIKNYGINVIETVTVNWEFDGILQPPVSWTSAIDTTNGAGPDAALVTLGSKNFIQGVSHNLKAWTSAPNGVADTIAINDSITVTLQPSLAGTFTIGGASPDYASFSNAIEALEINGICGPVVFNVRSGTYTEQVTVPEFRGSSATNTVTFQSESGNKNEVILTYTSEEYDRNFTVNFDGSHHVIFRNITLAAAGSSYGRVVDYRSGAMYNEIMDCIIEAPEIFYSSEYMALIFSNASSGPEDISHYNTLRNNILTGGSYGVYYQSYGTDTNQRMRGIRIEGNSFNNQYYRAIYLYGQASPDIIGNEISSNNADYYYAGIYAEYCYDSLRFTGNKINLPNGGIGIYQYYNQGSEGNEGLIANNFVIVRESGNEAVGIYSYNSAYQNYYHNNVLINGTNYNNYALNIRYGSYIKVHNNILTNINGGPVAAFPYDVEGAYILSDRNNLYSTGERVINYDGSEYTLAEWQQQTGRDSTSLSINPLFISETDLHVRKALLDNTGIPTGITTDIDGGPRSATTPDIGADEFTASGSDAALVYMDYPKPPFASGNFDIRVVLQNRGSSPLTSATVNLQIDDAQQTPFHWTGLLAKGESDTLNLGSFPFNSITAHNLTAWSENPNGSSDIDPSDDTISVENIAAGIPGGTYTIGGISPDFADFRSAANAINYGGILGPVTFNVRTGTYQENVTITEIYGASPINTITFQSESADSTSVVLTSNSDEFGADYTLKLDGADYLTFKNLTLETTDLNYGHAIYLLNGATHNQFSENIIRGAVSEGNTSTDVAVIYAVDSNDDGSEGGGEGGGESVGKNNSKANKIASIASLESDENSNEFTQNLIQDGSYGIYYGDTWGTGIILTRNVFENQAYQAISMIYQYVPAISSNIITTNTIRTDFTAVHLDYCQSGQLQNNKINLPNGGIGIYLSGNYGSEESEGVIANNFISIGGTSDAYGIQNSNSEYQHVYHNNINVYSSSSNGYAYYSNGGSQHNIRNNIFNNSGAGRAIYVDNAYAVAALDYNDLHAENVLGSWNGNSFANLTAWKAATGTDQHSVSVSPLFASSTDLHVNKGLLNNAGTPITSIPTDIDGEPRNTTTPDIGADEFEPTGVDIALTYLEPAEVKFGAGINPVRIVIQNTGATTLTNAQVSWLVNAVPQANYGWTGSLAASETDTLTIGSYDFLFGTAYEIAVTIDSPNGTNDIDPTDNTIEADNLYAAMGGVYTIGGSSPDFATFAAALQSLTVGGVYTHTIFNVRPGTYSQQLTLPEIAGAGVSSRIIFQSESGDSTSVILTFASVNAGANNYTVQLNGADCITFRKLTIRSTGSNYAHVVDITNGSDNNEFLNNRLIGTTTTSTNTNFAVIFSDGGNTGRNDNHNRFESNAITGGSYGFYYLGYSSGEGYRESGTIIRNNTISNAYYTSVMVQNQDSVRVVGNDIRTNNNVYFNNRLVRLQHCYNGSEVSKNNLQSLSGGYGISIYGNDGTEARRNIIANNIIQIGGGSTGMEAYGLSLEYSRNMNVYHNTIKITNTIPYSRALNSHGSDGLRILNNIFVNTGGGYGIGISGSYTVSALDHNNYYVTGTNFGYWDMDVPNFAAWKLAHDFDDHSLNVDPRFISAANLHVREVALNGTATPLAEIREDIDGEIRDALTPDIGADEFSLQSTDVEILSLESPKPPFNAGTSDITLRIRNSGVTALSNVRIDWVLNGAPQDAVNWTGSLNTRDSLDVTLGTRTFDVGAAYDIKAWTNLPNGGVDGDVTNDTLHVANLYTALDGTYTIGGVSPDFATFQQAVTALSLGGVVDSVIFNVRAGTYNEQFSIPEIIGSSAANTIVFQPENGDSTSVIISFSASSSKNYTVELAGADGVTFRNLTITTTNNSYGRVLNIRNKSNNNRFENNILQGRNLNTTAESMVVVMSTESQDNNNAFMNNRILYGSYGLYFYGQSNNIQEEGTVISGNRFENQYYRGIWLSDQRGAQILKNTFRTSSDWYEFYGMYLYRLNNGATISGNDILLTHGGNGIYYYDSHGTETQRGLIANNFINISGGNNQYYGLLTSSASYLYIYHNTITIATNNVNAYSLYLSSAYNFDVRNNIVTNTGGGFAVYSSSTSFTSDYNDFYTKGGNFAYHNGPQINLARWKSATGGDQHSFSIDPRYVSLTDLHAREIVLNDAGQGLSAVSEDIDGEPRNSTNPDIGADEFTPGLADAGVHALLKPTIPFLQGTRPVSVAIKNHGLDTLTTVQIQWTVNNEPQPVVNWTGALTSGDTTHVMLGNFLFNQATAYSIKSWSESPNNAVDTDHTNDTIRVDNLYSALTGTYTIGGTTPDFNTFTDAVTALVKGGIVNAVTFNIRAGTYNEQINLPAIVGTSATRSVVFQTESGADDVLLIFSADYMRNYTLQLDGASYFKFKNLSISATNTSYGTTVRIQNGSHHNTFESNTFNGIDQMSTSTELAVVYSVDNSNESNNSFVGNRFIRGSLGYFAVGVNYQSLESGTVIENNTFENQYYGGIWMYYQNAPKIRLNVISTNSNYTDYYAIRSIYNHNKLEIYRNSIQIANGGYGIYQEQNEASTGNRALIANNFISVGGTATAQGLFSYYSSYQNIYHNSIHITSTLTNTNSNAAYFQGGNYVDVKNNILVNSGGGYAFFQNSGNGFISNYNNLYTTGANLGYWSGNRANLEAWTFYSGQDQNSITVNPFFYSNTDLHVYNVSLNAGAVKINTITEDFDGNPRTTTPDIGADEFIPPTEDAGILSLYAPSNPVVEGPGEIIVQLYNNATANLNNVTINWTINGVQQPVFEWTGSLAPSASDSVTIGSFLFQSGIQYEIAAWSSQPNGLTDPVPFNDSTTVSGIYVGMSGIFTIGGVSADFPNFTQAVQALHVRNVAGPVTFRVNNGIYSERITINQILGASSDSPVTFESASGDSTKVTLTSATNSSQNYTLQLLGADHITFRKIKIAATGSTYGRVVDIRDGANYNRFENCLLQSTIFNSTFQVDQRAIVSSTGSKDEFNIFRNNVFRDGTYGLYYHGNGTSSTNLENGTIIENNLFEDQFYAGMWLYYQSAPKINNNTIVTFANNSGFYAIYGAYLNNGFEISRNRISSNAGGFGVRVDNASGAFSQRGQIYNNFVHLGGTSTAYGLFSSSSNNLDVSFNNINILSTNTSSSGTAFYNNSGSNIGVRNNVFVNKGGGYAYYNITSSAIPTSDYNDIYTTGTNLAFWQNNYTSLEALQAASGKDVHSLSVDPSFIGTADLHVNQSNLDGAGTPIAGITADIDGQLRHDVTPDIGADEFGAGLTTNDIGVVGLVGPANGCSLDSEESIVVRVQNFGIDTIANFSVTYVLNDTITVTENITGAELKGGKSLEYRFTTPTDLSDAGFYNFIFYTTLAGDSNVSNDTLYNSVIRHYPAVTAEVSANDTICYGSYVYLSASGGTTYAWRTLGSSYIFRYGQSISVNPGSDVTYVVEVSNSFGCVDTDTVSVVVLPAPERPSIEIVGSTSACTRDTVRLISSIKENIVWNTGAATSELQVFSPGTYTVTHIDTLTGCTSARSVTLSYTPPPYILTSPNPICQGNSATLSVMNGAQYRWSTGATSQSITVSPSSESTYTVDVINADGCEYLGLSTRVYVSPVLPAPQINSISPNTEICIGSSVTLTVTGNAQRYQWSNGQIGSTIVVSPTVSTLYTVTATNGQCSQGSAQASVYVTVLPQPVAPIIVATGSLTLSFCDADSITLTSSDVADSILWSTGAFTRSITVVDPGVYTVRVINQFGCSNSASVTITDPPVPYITGTSTVCEGESTTLAVNNGAFYQWSTGATTRSITVSPDTTTTYRVTITNEEGCQYLDSIRVTILPKPVITGITGDRSICLGEEITLNVSGTAGSFIWSEGGSGTSIKVRPLQTTTYTVTATNGCTNLNFNDFDKVKVTVLPLPVKPLITASGSTLICENAAITLTSSIAAGTIAWSTGDSTQTITVSLAGIYTLTNSNQFGCTQSEKVTIVNPDKPQLIVNGFSTICRGDSVQLTYTNASTFNWSTGQTTPSIFVSPADTTIFQVTASNTLGCTYTNSTRINVIDPVPPTSVMNMVPQQDQSGLSLPLALSWAPSVNASNYDIYIWLASETRPATPLVFNIDQISYLVKTGLTYGDVYNWQVIAKNSCHETPGSVQQFSLRELPDLVVEKVETPKTAFSGQLIDIAWEITNNGLGDTDPSKTWIEAVYLSADQTLEPGLDTYLGGVVNLTALTASQGYRNTASFRLPKGITGERYVIIASDYYNTILEVNNNNNSNRNLTSMLVYLTPPPDLQVETVLVPGNVFSGQTIDVSWTIRNEGTGTTDVNTWRDRILISTDSILRTGTVLADVVHSGHLDPTNAYTQTKSVQVPEGIFGTYFIYVVTDVNNNLFEHAFESNNTGRSAGMQVILTPPPDLVVTNITLPASASNKEAITVSWEVQNLGGSAISGKTWNDRVYISNLPTLDTRKAIFLGDRSVSPELNLGDTYTSSRSVVIPDEITGPFFIYVAADIDNRVFEYVNETNNVTKSDTIDILSPDLIVSQIVLPATGNSGKAIDVTWTIKNDGPGKLFSKTWEDIIMVDNSAIYHADSVKQVGTLSYTAALLPGETVVKQKTVILPDGLSGTQFVYVKTDRKSQVYEGDKETNNISYQSLQVNLSPWADLEPQVVLFDTGPATAGIGIPITYRVTNTGFVDATGSWTDKVFISARSVFDPKKDSIFVKQIIRSSTLKIDSSYVVSTTLDLSPWLTEGTYYFYLVADARNTVFEHTDEVNNIVPLGSVYIKEYPPIDFAVDTLAAPASAFSGTLASFQWKVKNVGDVESLSGYWFDAVLLSNDSLFSQTGDLLLKSWQKKGPLAPGRTYTVDQKILLPDGIAGNKYLILVNDYGKDETEKFLLKDEDRSNNFKAVPIHITLTPPSDLIVTEFDVPTEGISGQPVTVSWTVTNQGVGETNVGAWTDKVYLSTDFKVDKDDIAIKANSRNGNLNAGESYTVTTDVTIPMSAEGNYILILKTDNNDVQYEHGAENNNTSTSIIAVTRPLPADLVVTGVTAPDTITAGENVTVQWTVKNTGTNPAVGVMSDIVYFSVDQTWDINDVVAGEYPSTINLPPLSEQTRSLTASVQGVSLADYYILVRTDVRNNIYESADENNMTASVAPVTVSVPELLLNVPSTATLVNGASRYYRLEIPSSLEGESLLVALQGDSLNGANEFYIRYGAVPTRVEYDFSHENPFVGDQEIVIPDAVAGTYYLMVYGSTREGTSQSIELLAKVLNFEIRSVNAKVGGNTGKVTVQINGSKFVDNMRLMLRRGTHVIGAGALQFINSTRVYATFDLTGAETGQYDLLGVNNDLDTAKLVKSFTVQQGQAPLLLTNVVAPASTRPDAIISISIEFANGGNVNIDNPVVKLISAGGAPISFTVEGLSERQLELPVPLSEPRGPEGVLRPGASGTVVIYGKGSSNLSFVLVLPVVNKIQ